ncbi:MAG: hypothetical protein LUC41_03005, partial [Clostridiales bacterium]|nr:hypothetical protein [Clostridiales bacterium]
YMAHLSAGHMAEIEQCLEVELGLMHQAEEYKAQDDTEACGGSDDKTAEETMNVPDEDTGTEDNEK